MWQLATIPFPCTPTAVVITTARTVRGPGLGCTGGQTTRGECPNSTGRTKKLYMNLANVESLPIIQCTYMYIIYVHIPYST